MLEQMLETNTNSQACLASGEQIVENLSSQQQITNIAPLMISFKFIIFACCVVMALLVGA
jgi:membrane protein insertase Oxa1/YidC/SpoIIIJ